MDATVFDTQWNADVVEECGDVLAVGCYHLEDAAGSDDGQASPRKGCVWLLHASTLQSFDRWEHTHAGVLDLRWMEGGQSILVACADGKVRRLARRECLQEIGDATVSETLVLSVDARQARPEAVVSSADGGVSVLDGSTMQISWQREAAHTYEAWVASFDAHSDLIFSGGDDGALRIWDPRINPAPGAVATSLKAHDSLGVTAVISDPLRTQGLISGGYDDRVRFWDLRNSKLVESHPSPFALEGGVWRLKVHPTDPHTLLVPAMYAGAYVLDRRGSELETTEGTVANGGVRILGHYRGHKSIVYGACWLRRGAARHPHRAVTCSFYDHALHSWNPH